MNRIYPQDEPSEDERAEIALRARLIQESNERLAIQDKSKAVGRRVRKKKTNGRSPKAEADHPWRRKPACGD